METTGAVSSQQSDMNFLVKIQKSIMKKSKMIEVVDQPSQSFPEVILM